MKFLLLLMLIVLLGCSNNSNQLASNVDTLIIRDTVIIRDTLFAEKRSSAVYSNQRFKNVTVENFAANKYFIKGNGQIFEAAFSWVVEDGHEEIKKGFETTDAGAPEWGRFGFVVEVGKKRPNSTLHLILFETSANDGSRQHQLPLLLN